MLGSRTEQAGAFGRVPQARNRSMEFWTIAAWAVPVHVLGSAVALALVSVNRGESSAAPPCDDAHAPVEPGIVPNSPWR